MTLSVQLRTQIQGGLVAFASSSCGIGSYKVGPVDSLGDCVLPAPFTSLEQLES